MQDAQTAQGTCPLCRGALSMAQMFSEEQLRPPGWHAKRRAAAAAAEAAAKAEPIDCSPPDEEPEAAPWVSSTKLTAVLNQLKATNACVPDCSVACRGASHNLNHY